LGTYDLAVDQVDVSKKNIGQMLLSDAIEFDSLGKAIESRAKYFKV